MASISCALRFWKSWLKRSTKKYKNASQMSNTCCSLACFEGLSLTEGVLILWWTSCRYHMKLHDTHCILFETPSEIQARVGQPICPRQTSLQILGCLIFCLLQILCWILKIQPFLSLSKSRLWLLWKLVVRLHGKNSLISLLDIHFDWHRDSPMLVHVYGGIMLAAD